KAGGVWICSAGQLIKFNEGEKPVTLGTFSEAKPEPTVLFESSRAGIWLGTMDHGLFHYDGVHFENVPISDQSVTSLAEDREGNIWAGTASGGLNRLCPRAVELKSVETGLPFGTVQSLCEEPTGTTWATTQNGLLLRGNNGAWETVSADATWPGG